MTWLAHARLCSGENYKVAGLCLLPLHGPSNFSLQRRRMWYTYAKMPEHMRYKTRTIKTFGLDASIQVWASLQAQGIIHQFIRLIRHT